MSIYIYKLDALESPEDPRDYNAESVFPADLSLPKVWDPRKSILPIRDQKSQGSCVAQSAAALKEIQERKNVDFEEYMSPQFVYNNRINQPSEGMYSRDAMKILYKKGIAPEAEYPYGVIETPDKISQHVLSTALNYKALGYAYVNTVDTAKAAIYRSGACIICVPVYHSGRDMWRPLRLGDPIQGLHAMCLVGWTEDGFIVRNSWGESFGDKGYTIFPFKDWGMHSECWTLIDDESSKPDPKYSKWYWKTWRAVKNTFFNMGTSRYPAIVLAAGCVLIAIRENIYALIGIPITILVVAVFSYIKKWYLAKDKVLQ